MSVVPPRCDAPADSPASDWVLRWLEGCPPGATMLDWAAGSGRHARAAHALGLIVTAVDRDPAALDGLSDLPVERIVADLERGPWPFAHRRFDVVVCTNYLFRPRLALLAALVADGGRLIYETFAVGHERFGRPANPTFLLRDGELLDLARAAGLRVAAYEHGERAGPRPALVQRLCALRGPAHASIREPIRQASIRQASVRQASIR